LVNRFQGTALTSRVQQLGGKYGGPKSVGGALLETEDYKT